VDLIGPYTPRGKNGTEIDFMHCTMINPASSWFQIVELPVTTDVVIPMDTKEVITSMLCTTELDMANTVETSDIDVFLTSTTWVICSTCHTVLKASPGAETIGWTCSLTSPYLPRTK
jgi:LSD1 subclass zinc finger protein